VPDSQFSFHYSKTSQINASLEEVFSLLDNPMNLSSHMGRSSIMMAGSRMNMKLDGKRGQAVGAEILLEGSMLGIPLYVREFVTVHEKPIRKIWETKGPQKMVIIDQYRMGFELVFQSGQTHLTVFIDYNIPLKGRGLILGKFFSQIYAKWCTDKMVNDAVLHFS
jgi:hypothetical protein